MRQPSSLHGRNPKNDEGLLGPAKFQVPQRSTEPLDASGATTIQFVITVVRGSQVKTGLCSTSLPQIILSRIDERLHSLLSFVVYLPRSIPSCRT